MLGEQFVFMNANMPIIRRGVRLFHKAVGSGFGHV
jgi:hypothetical protein